MDQKLYKRQIIDTLNKYLFTQDIIVLHGARQVGKTSILKYIQDKLIKQKKSTYFVDLEDSRYKEMIDDGGVEEFLKYLKEEGAELSSKRNNKVFVFIDEIQYLENPSPFLKLMADHHKTIKLIVSGSSSFDIKNKFKDSLVGRTVNFEILPLSFEEFLFFKKHHFKKEKSYTAKKTGDLVALFSEYTLYGGYPKIVLTPNKEIKEKYLQQIIDTYVKKDIRDLANIKETSKFNKTIQILASQTGQLLNLNEVSNTIGISKITLEHYIFLLEQTYIIKLVRPYSTNKRHELSKTPKIFLFDTGLMHMLWLKELPKEILGQAFETSVFAELAKKYGMDKVYYWRTTDKKEIDFVLKQKQTLLPIEAKLNFAQSQISALKYFCSKYKSDKYRIVGLRGEVKNKTQIYPWEL